MTDTITPAMFNEAATEASALYAAYRDTELDVAIAIRSGDEDAKAAAQSLKEKAQKAWYPAYLKAEEYVASALDAAGFDRAAVKKYVK